MESVSIRSLSIAELGNCHLYDRFVQLHHGDMSAQAHEAAAAKDNIHGLSVLDACLRVCHDPAVRAEEMRILAEDGRVSTQSIVADCDL